MSIYWKLYHKAISIFLFIAGAEEAFTGLSSIAGSSASPTARRGILEHKHTHSSTTETQPPSLGRVWTFSFIPLVKLSGWDEAGEGKDLLGHYSIVKATGNVFKAPRCPFCAGFVLTEVQAPREFQVGALSKGIDCRHSELVVSLFCQAGHCELRAGHMGLVAPDPGEAGELLALHDVAVHWNGPLHPRRGPCQRHWGFCFIFHHRVSWGLGGRFSGSCTREGNKAEQSNEFASERKSWKSLRWTKSLINLHKIRMWDGKAREWTGDALGLLYTKITESLSSQIKSKFWCSILVLHS